MEVYDTEQLLHYIDQYQAAYTLLGREAIEDQALFYREQRDKCKDQIQTLKSVSGPPGSCEMIKAKEQLSHTRLLLRAIREVLENND